MVETLLSSVPMHVLCVPVQTERGTGTDNSHVRKPPARLSRDSIERNHKKGKMVEWKDGEVRAASNGFVLAADGTPPI